MRILRSPGFWYPPALLLLAWLGATLLQSPACVQLTERERTAYGPRPLWLATFDAVSATCSAGLTLFDVREQYTPLGRWTLLALGLAGTALHLAALRAIFARAVGAPWLTRGMLVSVALLAGALAIGALRPGAMRVEADASSGIQNAISAFFGLGISTSTAGSAAAGPLLAVTILGLVGLAALVVTPPAPRAGPPLRWIAALSALGVAFALVLSLAAWGMHALEHPRAESGWRGHGTRETAQHGHAAIVARDRLLQVMVTAHAGWSPLPIADRAVGEGSKLILALAILLGGLGAVTGGTVWLLILACDGAALLGARTASTERLRIAAGRALVAILALFLITTLGLLMVEAGVASRFEAPATLGDAVLDAASTVCGAALTSGLIENLTSAHLSKGMGQSVDSYLYATVWVMLAMLAGRIVPIIALSTAGSPLGAAAEPGSGREG